MSALTALPSRHLSSVDPGPDQLSDNELCALASRGSAIGAQAFDLLYQRHATGLHHFTRARLDDDHSADDALQEIFLRAFAGLPGFRGESCFRTWLHRIAINTCHDIRRRNQRWQRQHIQLDSLPEPGQPDPLDDESLTASDSHHHLQCILTALRDQDRQILDLRHRSGLSLAAIGERLQLGSSAVKMRLHRAEAAARRLARRVAPTMIEG